MYKNTADRGTPQMTVWRVCIACLIPKATNTRSEYVIFVAFAHQRLPVRSSLLRYTYIACNGISVINQIDTQNICQIGPQMYNIYKEPTTIQYLQTTYNTIFTNNLQQYHIYQQCTTIQYLQRTYNNTICTNNLQYNIYKQPTTIQYLPTIYNNTVFTKNLNNTIFTNNLQQNNIF